MLGVPTREYSVTQVPVSEILCDATFNIRGMVTPFDVTDLIENIKEVGLISPILIRPLKRSIMGKKYSIVSGHRRYTACATLKTETIACNIDYDMDDKTATLINFYENLVRSELTIAQEALGVSRLKDLGFTAFEISKHMGKSWGWVITREQYLDLPAEVQDDIAGGYVQLKDIKELWLLRGNKEKLYEVVREIKDAKLKGVKRKKKNLLQRKRNFLVTKSRKEDDVDWMIDHFQQTPLGDSVDIRLAICAMSWAAGLVSDLILFQRLDEYYAEKGLAYRIPYDLAEVK